MGNFKKRLAENMHKSMEELIIEQKFNELFFAKKNVKAELKFLRLLMEREGKQQERTGLHLSAIMESENKFCLREQVLSLFFKQCQNENIKVGLKRIFEEGDVIHQKWQRLFIRGGLGLPEDMDRSRFVEKYDLSYTPDAQIRILKTDGMPVEVKSMNSFAYQKAKNHPKGENQLNMYMHFEKQPRGIVLMEDKNTQDFKVKLIKYDKEKARPYVVRLRATQDGKQTFLESGRLPRKCCSGADCKRALECNMRDACFDVGRGRIKL